MQLFNQYKNKLIKGGILLLLFIMFLFPSASFEGASSGLLLWFHHVLPNLLPFVIISNLILKLNIQNQVSKVFYPVLGRIFRISRNGCYPIVLGILSGIPMGAKSTADLCFEQKIQKSEGQFLLGMCNNASPMFILGYISITQLKLPQIKYVLFAIVYASSILGAILFRILYSSIKSQKNESNKVLLASIDQKSKSSVSFSFNLLDQAIMNGFEVVTKIGGYIILFSIFAALLKAIGPNTGYYKAFLMGLLEITNGINQLCTTDLDLNTKIVLVTVLTTFGGLSGVAQTKSVLGDSRLSIVSYIVVKLISAVIALLLSLFYVTL